MVLFSIVQYSLWYSAVYGFRGRYYRVTENMFNRWEKNLVNGRVDKMSI